MNTGSEAQFNLSAWALKNQQMVSFFMLLVIAMGVFCYEKLPRNEDPAFTIKTAVVSAQWPGASVTDTTRLLTDTLEKKAAGNALAGLSRKRNPCRTHRYPRQPP